VTMHLFSALRLSARSLLACAGLLALGSIAAAADTYTGGSLSIPSLEVGTVLYSNVVLTVSGIVSGPSGTAPNGSVDTYDPLTQELTVQSVVFNAHTYYNVVARVGSLGSIGSVSGADSFGAGTLTIPKLVVGSATYSNVELAVVPSDVVSIGGGMPLVATDQFTVSTGHLLVPVIEVGGKVYTNVTIAVTPKDVICINCGAGSSSSSSSSGGSSSSSSSSSGGTTSSSGGFWIPFGESGTINGFGVLPSNLSSNTLTQVSTTGTEVDFSLSFTYTFSGNTVTGEQPYAQFYAAKGSDGNQHVYSAKLTSAASAPVPVQVSSFSTAAANTVCGSANLGYSNVRDPTSIWLVFTVFTAAEIASDPSACSDNNIAGTTYLIHATDSSATAPILVTGVQTNLELDELLNGSGTIAGIVAFDTANNLNFYPASGGLPSFASPHQIASGLTTNVSSDSVLFNRTGTLLSGGSVLFISVSPVTPGGTTQLWRVPASGSASQVFSTTGTVSGYGVYDNANYYFEVTSQVSPTTYSYYSVPITSGNATLIASSSTEDLMVDSDGSRLILTSSGFNGTSFSANVLTLPVTPGSTFSTLVSGLNDLNASAFLDYATDQVFVDLVSQTGVSGEVITATGTVKSPLTAGTEYIGSALDFTKFGVGADQTLVVTGITATDNSMGGGALYSENTGSLARTPITQNGSPYVIPSGINLYGFEIANSLVQGAGYPIGSGGSFGFLIDLTKNQIVTTTPSTTTTLEPFY